MRRERIVAVILKSLAELSEDAGISGLDNANEETRLYGGKGPLDSIGLVNLIADVEEKVGREFGKDVILADERAMSQRRSPFARVGTFADYIESLLDENKTEGAK